MPFDSLYSIVELDTGGVKLIPAQNIAGGLINEH